MIPMTHPDLKIRVSLMVEILRLKITLGTLWQVLPSFDKVLNGGG